MKFPCLLKLCTNTLASIKTAKCSVDSLWAQHVHDVLEMRFLILLEDLLTGAYILLSNHPSKDSLPKDDEGPESGNGRKFLEKIIYDLPLRIDAFGGNGKSWISILQVKETYPEVGRCPSLHERSSDNTTPTLLVSWSVQWLTLAKLRFEASWEECS